MAATQHTYTPSMADAAVKATLAAVAKLQDILES
jgi:hypothetical protein